MKKIKKILVPVDFTEHSDRAVDLAADMAGAFHARITLLHVIEQFTYSVTDTILVVDHYRALREVAEPLMEGLQKKLIRRKMKVEAEIVRGNPAQQIIKKARNQGSDLVIMGTRGRTGIKHVVLGSVAEKVVRLAPCPVVTVGPSPSGRKVNSGRKAARRKTIGRPSGKAA
ncbi:MAG TPA: universal stress protein [Nitrospiria bacterium]